MISFEGFKPDGNEPIYLQIVGYVKRGIVSGEIASGEELPSRRMLSALLGVNPNTAQKACRMLEEEGILVSHTGAKSYVTYTEEKRRALTTELVADGVRAAALRLKHLGITLDEAIRLISRAWEEDEKE
ncbi:MAG TPA: GntR family transcriptional regulator [Candidatus Scatomorpha merdigallinarum]|nr:GntR family transcriptional regulator [Candidatus Scatomorpha merdigallinarum]